MNNHPSTKKPAYDLRNKNESKSKSKKTSKSVKMAASSSKNSASNEAPEKRTASGTALTLDRSMDTTDRSDASDTTLSSDPGSDRVLSCMADMKKMLSDKLDNVLCELNTIKGDLAQTKKSVSELDTRVNFVTDKLTALEKEEIPILKEKIKRQEEEIDGKLTLMEIHHRKQNLLVYGMPDKQYEDIITTVSEVLCYFLRIAPEEARQIPLVNAHRLPTPGNVKQLVGQQEPGPRPIIIRFSSMFDRDRLLRTFESQPRHQQKGAAAASSPAQQGNSDPAYSRVTIRSDLPPKLKRERGRLAEVAYKLLREEKVSTRIRLVGSKIILQTRTFTPGGSQNTAWATWSE